jgi:hypothetical protein
MIAQKAVITARATALAREEVSFIARTLRLSRLCVNRIFIFFYVLL